FRTAQDARPSRGAAGDAARLQAPSGLPDAGLPPAWHGAAAGTAPGTPYLCGLCRLPAALAPTGPAAPAAGRIQRLRRPRQPDPDPVIGPRAGARGRPEWLVQQGFAGLHDAFGKAGPAYCASVKKWLS